MGSGREGGGAAVLWAVAGGAAGFGGGCVDLRSGGRRAAGLLDRGLAPCAERGDGPIGSGGANASNGEAGGRGGASPRVSVRGARTSSLTTGGGGVGLCRDNDGSAPAICAGRKASSGIESELAPGGIISRFWGGLRSVAESPVPCSGFGGAL